MGNNPYTGRHKPAMMMKPADVQDGIPVMTLTALRMGDHEAYKKVYLHYIDPVVEFLKMLTKSDGDAEEIAQEVFVSLWEKRSKIDPKKNIRGYIYTYARNAVLNYFKHKKVEDKYLHFTENEARSYESSDDLMVARETELLIRIAIDRMPSRRKEIFEMSRFEGLSNEEIAERLDISKNTVENHLTHANRDIRKLLHLFLLFFV